MTTVRIAHVATVLALTSAGLLSACTSPQPFEKAAQTVPVLNPPSASIASFNTQRVRFAAEGLQITHPLGQLQVRFEDGAPGLSPQQSQPNAAKYADVWAGIDVVYEPVASGLVKSTYQLAPYAHVADIRLHYDRPTQLTSEGQLEWRFEWGALRESPPVAWQDIDGQRVNVPVRFKRVDAHRVGFDVGDYDLSQPLVIDPTFSWHTFFGSSTANDRAIGVNVDAQGNIYVVGDSGSSWNGPSGQAPLNPRASALDIVILKLDKDGNYVWHTFIGGAGNETGWSVIAAGNSDIYMLALADASFNGPGGVAPLRAYSGGIDTAVIRLTSSGNYVWHTFYGAASSTDSAYILRSDGTNLYISGFSQATWNGPGNVLPKNAHASSGSGEDVWALKLNTNGGYIWHSFFGGAGNQFASSIALDDAANLYISGEGGNSWNGPANQSPLHPYSGGNEAYLLKVDANGNYVWHTFYGSGGNDYASDTVVDGANGMVYLLGNSQGAFDGPSGQAPLHPFTTGPNPNANDVYIIKLTTAGSYQWHTFYGSQEDEYSSVIMVGNDGSIYTVGNSLGTWNGSGNIAPIDAYSAGRDAHILKLSPDGAYQWHGFYGGGGTDDGTSSALLINSGVRVIAAGYSNSNWNGTEGQAPIRAYTGNHDGFVMQVLDVPPISVQFTQASANVNENMSNASVAVVLSSSSAQTITVSFNTSDGTATAGSDYTAQSGTLVFAPGETNKTIGVPITNDTTSESDETFHVTLSSPINANLGSLIETTLTIANDDAQTLQVLPNMLSFAAVISGANPAAQSLAISGATVWVASADVNWVSIAPNNGSGPGNTNVSVNSTAFGVGTYTATLTVNAPGAANSPQTVSITLTVSPASSGDAFENNNTCALAKPIPTDGTQQAHNFHQQGDVDWISFNGVSGTTYIIQATPMLSSPVDLTLELYDGCNTFSGNQAFNFTPGVRMEFVPSLTGTFFLKWSNETGTVFGPDAAYNVSVVQKAVTPPLGAIIIVAGRRDAADSLQANIQKVTNDVYKLFRDHGYPPERIRHLTTDSSAPGAGPKPTATALQDAILNWASPLVGEGRALTIYLMDHGGSDIFYLDNTFNETLTPLQLDSWLTQLEAQPGKAGLKINIIIEACQSGSFVTAPGLISKAGRVVIASAGADNNALASTQGAMFSDQFLAALDRGSSLFDAFLRARWAAQIAYPSQTPLLDDNGDGQSNTNTDGVEAQKRGFTYQGTFADPNEWPPYISAATAVTTTQAGSRDVTAKVAVGPGDTVRNVYAVIYPPDYIAPPPQSQLLQESLQTVTLLNKGSEFGASYPGFTKEGVYRLVVYAEDNDGEQAQPFSFNVVVGSANKKVFLPVVVR